MYSYVVKELPHGALVCALRNPGRYASASAFAPVAAAGRSPWGEKAFSASGTPLELRLHEGYDHGYYFISTFMEEHLRRHAARLCN